MLPDSRDGIRQEGVLALRLFPCYNLPEGIGQGCMQPERRDDMKTIYYGGTIRTMSRQETTEAVFVNDARIAAVGTYSELRQLAPDAGEYDLQGRTMLPAFIDAHSHLSSYAMSFLQVPLDECCSFEEIAGRIENFMKTNHVKPGEWIIAKGYDHNALKEKKHPDIAFLDETAPDNPLVLQHASGHVGVFNSRALAELGITANTSSPAGGRIGLADGKLTGYLEENAFISSMKKLPMSSMEDMMLAYRKAQESYAAHGITMVQEGMTVGQMLPLYQYLTAKQMLHLDVCAYLVPEDADGFLNTFPESVGAYHDHFRIGGYKIVLDGSPQGRTAWMETPYRNQEPPYYGYGTLSDEAVQAAVRLAAEHRMQILAHCNGDAAAEQFIRAVEVVSHEYPVKEIRPVMIHAQLLRPDQLARVAELGIIPSFFAAHVYHWGDAHIRNFGMERASNISPACSALKHGIRFTFHQDTPVIEPDMLETVWCAVNRVTKAGIILGEQECISVVEALKAVTINAAYQYGEESVKGSIEPGKAADFVILDRDPVTVDPVKIRNIQVLHTISDGKVIY